MRAQTAAGKAPAYLYLFSRAHTYSEGVDISGFNPATAGAYHMADTPFWLDTIDRFNIFRTTRAWTPADRTMAARMSDIVIGFARTGRPGTPAASIVNYDPKDEQITEFGEIIRVVKLEAKQLDFLANTPAQSGGRGGRGRGGRGGGER